MVGQQTERLQGHCPESPLSLHNWQGSCDEVHGALLLFDELADVAASLRSRHVLVPRSDLLEDGLRPSCIWFSCRRGAWVLDSRVR